jgi:hypothetical protein
MGAAGGTGGLAVVGVLVGDPPIVSGTVSLFDNARIPRESSRISERNASEESSFCALSVMRSMRRSFYIAWWFAE